ncbi:MAG: hypothetical protein K6F78_09870 [Bacteroidaceae bacterium]|jgi:tellurite resistance protein|nr:hypothetical protein [Bacteroidaceae bacterium]
MFLLELSKKEKQTFLNLANLIVGTDGVVMDAEKQMLAQYAAEMQLKDEDIVVETDLDKLIADAKEFSPRVKRIVYVELLAIANVDGLFDEKEKAIFVQLAKAFQYDEAFVEAAIERIDFYISASQSLSNFIAEGE